VVIALADRLGKTIGEIEDMPYNELIEWVAYLEVLADGRPKS
jgi:hypothetical protein